MKREHLLYYAIAVAILIVGLAWAGLPTSTILVGLVVLACPLMMIFMMRDHGGGHGGDHREEPHEVTDHTGHRGQP